MEDSLIDRLFKELAPLDPDRDPYSPEIFLGEWGTGKVLNVWMYVTKTKVYLSANNEDTGEKVLDRLKVRPVQVDALIRCLLDGEFEGLSKLGMCRRVE